MAALKHAAAAALALAVTALAGPCFAREAPLWRGHVAEAAARFTIPEEWILRVIDAESGGRTHLDGRPITSTAGAMGLMQLMPETWAELRRQLGPGLGPDPHDPRGNILAGTAYLRRMYDRFGYPGLFAAYHAGPGRYRDYIERGRPLPRETRAYVARIAGRGRRGGRGLVPHGGRDGAVLQRENGGQRGTKTAAIPPIFLVRPRAARSHSDAATASEMWETDRVEPAPGPVSAASMKDGDLSASPAPTARRWENDAISPPTPEGERDTVFLLRRSAARPDE